MRSGQGGKEVAYATALRLTYNVLAKGTIFVSRWENLCKIKHDKPHEKP
jgi:hypothetical protein